MYAVRSAESLRVRILMLKQDDPRKCSAAKMIRFGLARDVKKVIDRTVTLNPFAAQFLLPADRKAGSITAIDGSWNRADGLFAKSPGGMERRLPPMLAGNPVNYSRVGMLSTAEAVAGALYIMGFAGQARRILDKFKWGHTFYDLNCNLLEDYARMSGPEDVNTISSEYGLPVPDIQYECQGGNGCYA